MGAHLSLSGRGRGGRLLTFSAFRMSAYSRWARIRGWALIRINTVNLSHSTGVIFFAFFRGANGKGKSERGAPDMHARRGKVPRAPRPLRNSFARKTKK